eukprot:Nk52_evm9s2367 gene=Nk52_evmTU9s2367
MANRRNSQDQQPESYSVDELVVEKETGYRIPTKKAKGQSGTSVDVDSDSDEGSYTEPIFRRKSSLLGNSDMDMMDSPRPLPGSSHVYREHNMEHRDDMEFRRKSRESEMHYTHSHNAPAPPSRLHAPSRPSDTYSQLQEDPMGREVYSNEYTNSYHRPYPQGRSFSAHIPPSSRVPHTLPMYSQAEYPDHDEPRRHSSDAGYDMHHHPGDYGHQAERRGRGGTSNHSQGGGSTYIGQQSYVHQRRLSRGVQEGAEDWKRTVAEEKDSACIQEAFFPQESHKNDASVTMDGKTLSIVRSSKVKFRAESLEDLKFKLIIRQNAKNACMSGVQWSGKAGTRRVTDPTPVVQLKAYSKSTGRQLLGYLPFYPMLSMRVSLLTVEKEPSSQKKSLTLYIDAEPNLTGTTAASLSFTEDFVPPTRTDPSPHKEAAFFVFSDLMIHKRGEYVLYFELFYFGLGGHHSKKLGGIYSGSFVVNNTREFMKIGMQPASKLSLKLAGQGVKINVRSDKGKQEGPGSWCYPYTKEQAKAFLPAWVPSTFNAPFLSIYLPENRCSLGKGSSSTDEGSSLGGESDTPDKHDDESSLAAPTSTGDSEMRSESLRASENMEVDFHDHDHTARHWETVGEVIARAETVSGLANRKHQNDQSE